MGTQRHLSEGRKIWNNYASYQVFQNTNLIGEFKTLPEALSYGKQYSNASIQTLEHRVLWDNFKKLQVWGWNGSSGAETIKAHVSNTIGLDVDSPSYFELADARQSQGYIECRYRQMAAKKRLYRVSAS